MGITHLEYDDRGQITAVGQVAIIYEDGHVALIGDACAIYDDRGQLVQIGWDPVVYAK